MTVRRMLLHLLDILLNVDAGHKSLLYSFISGSCRETDLLLYFLVTYLIFVFPALKTTLLFVSFSVLSNFAFLNIPMFLGRCK